MRKELFYNPRLLCERLAEFSVNRRRLGRLRATPAAGLMCSHINSLELLDLLAKRPPRIIYDIGANIGTWTQLAKSIYPLAEVHAFEPLAGHVARFVCTAGLLERVRLHQLALGNKQGSTTMRVVDLTDASSVLPLTAEGREMWQVNELEVQEVKIDRLDDWINTNKIPHPDLIKLDVQGFELEVLKGATNAMRHANAILTEVSFREFYRGQCLFHDSVSFMADRGFELLAFGHGMPLGRPLQQADALFVKANMHSTKGASVDGVRKAAAE